MNPLLLLGAAVILYSLVKQGKQAYDYFEFNPIKFQLDKAGIFSTSLIYTFQIKNPTSTTASVKNIYGKIMAGGKQVGTFNVPNAFNIPSSGAVNVIAKVSLSNTEFLKLLASAVKSRQVPEISFIGDITTTLLGAVPFSYTALVAQDFSLSKKL